LIRLFDIFYLVMFATDFYNIRCGIDTPKLKKILHVDILNVIVCVYLTFLMAGIIGHCPSTKFKTKILNHIIFLQKLTSMAITGP
jgi:hypothetical protein